MTSILLFICLGEDIYFVWLPCLVSRCFWVDREAFVGVGSFELPSSNTEIVANIDSSWLRSCLNCTTNIIFTPSGWRVFVWIIVGFDPVITKLFARGMGMTLCSSRKSIHKTMSKSPILTITKSVRLVQVPSLMGVLFTTPKMGNYVELMAFVFPMSWCQRIFKCFASVSVMKLWVAPESTIVLLATLWFTQISTYISPCSIASFVSSTVF